MNIIDFVDTALRGIAAPTLWLAGLMPSPDPVLSIVTSTVLSVLAIHGLVTLAIAAAGELSIAIELRATNAKHTIDPRSISARQRWPFRAYCGLMAARRYTRRLGTWAIWAIIVAVTWVGAHARTHLDALIDPVLKSPPSIADSASLVAIAVVIAALATGSSLRARTSVRSQRHQDAIRTRATTARTAGQIGYGVRKCLERLERGVPVVFDQALRRADHPRHRAFVDSSGNISVSSDEHFWPRPREDDQYWRALFAETSSLICSFAQCIQEAVDAEAFPLVIRSAPAATIGMVFGLRPTPRIVRLSIPTGAVPTEGVDRNGDGMPLPSKLDGVDPKSLERLLQEETFSLIGDLRLITQEDRLRRRLQEAYDWVAHRAAEANWYALTMDHYSRTAHRVIEGSGWAKASERLAGSR